MTDFRDFLLTQARRFGTKQAFAQALGITPGRFSRLLRGNDSMEVVGCLRLAKVSGESADRVLRLAGKGEIADLIAELYGRPSLTARERALIDNSERIPEQVRGAFDVLIHYAREVADAGGGRGAERIAPGPPARRRRAPAKPKRRRTLRSENG